MSNDKSQTPNKKNGYTLIEILVALTIIGLLFSFGYVSFRDFSRRQALSGAAKSIQGDLRLAQSDAISGQKPDDANCKMPSYTLDSYDFKIILPSEYKIEANCTGSVNPVLIKDVDLSSSGIAFSMPLINPLEFKVLGQGTNIGDTDWILTLTQNGTANTATVTVTSGGEIK